MLRRKIKIFLITLLIISIIIPSYLSFVSSSSGNIKINTTGTSALGQQVQAGGTVNLYFGGVTWNGSQFYLILTSDATSDFSSGEVYTPPFSVYDVADTVTSHTYTGENGAWIVGYNWINGSIPTSALGSSYIKAVDHLNSPLAVTDTYITITPLDYRATLTIDPPSGPGGIPIQITGSNYPINQLVSILYLDPTTSQWNPLTAVTANGTGHISVTSEAPDLRKASGQYDSSEMYTTISYRSAIGAQVFGYANYNEYHRGLKNVGNVAAYGLYGNGTDLTSTIRLMRGDSLYISGKWFHPGLVYIRWDSLSLVSGTVTSSEWLNANIIDETTTNATGYFSTTITIPQVVEAGDHYIAVEDTQGARVIIKIFVAMATLTLSPASGPGGATVQFSGSLYPQSSPIDVYYFDDNLYAWKYWQTTTSTESGTISFSAEVPDLMTSVYSAGGNSSSTLKFKTIANGIAYSYAEYAQMQRGLLQVGSFSHSWGLVGNGTNLSPNVNVTPGGSLFISGKYFHPGVVYIKFDGTATAGSSIVADQWSGAQILTSTTASELGSFQTSVVIPSAEGGEHFLAVEDSQASVFFKIYVNGPVSPTATPTPTTAPNPTQAPVPTPTPTPLDTPIIDVSCRSTTTTTGFRVEISGDLSLNGNPLEDAPVLLSYSKTGGTTWESLTMVRTLSNGDFKAVWQPDVTGNYLIKAVSERTSTMNEASKVVNLAITPDDQNNVFTLNSNSTITQFAFNSTSNQLSFIASGETGTTGYVEIYIPKTIISDISQLTAYIDDQQISFNSESQGDSWLITFIYSHSTHKITMNLGDAESITPATDIPWIYIAIVAAIVAVVAVSVLALRKRK